MDLLVTLFLLVLIAGVAQYIIAASPLDSKVKQVLLVIGALILLIYLVGLFLGFAPHPIHIHTS